MGSINSTIRTDTSYETTAASRVLRVFDFDKDIMLCCVSLTVLERAVQAITRGSAIILCCSY